MVQQNFVFYPAFVVIPDYCCQMNKILVKNLNLTHHLIIIKLNDCSCNLGIYWTLSAVWINCVHAAVNSFNILARCTQNRLIELYSTYDINCSKFNMSLLFFISKGFFDLKIHRNAFEVLTRLWELQSSKIILRLPPSSPILC